MERELSTLSPSPLPPLPLLRLLALSLTSFFPIQKANMNDGGERGAAGRRAAPRLCTWNLFQCTRSLPLSSLRDVLIL